MSMKGEGQADDWQAIDRRDDGVGWIAYPDEAMQRASHALVDDGDVWVVDPVDVPDLDDFLADLGEVAGVVTLLDRHKRDAAAVATRHDVSVHLHRSLMGIADDIDAPIERYDDRLGSTDYESIRVVDNRFWTEVALYDGETLVVPEAVGTTSYFRTDRERLGVHPALRLFPPRGALGDLDPDRVLVGHGEGILNDASGALRDGLRGSRRRSLSLYSSIGMEMMGLG